MQSTATMSQDALDLCGCKAEDVADVQHGTQTTGNHTWLLFFRILWGTVVDMSVIFNIDGEPFRVLSQKDS